MGDRLFILPNLSEGLPDPRVSVPIELWGLAKGSAEVESELNTPLKKPLLSFERWI